MNTPTLQDGILTQSRAGEAVQASGGRVGRQEVGHQGGDADVLLDRRRFENELCGGAEDRGSLVSRNERMSTSKRKRTSVRSIMLWKYFF